MRSQVVSFKKEHSVGFSPGGGPLHVFIGLGICLKIMLISI